MPNRSANSTAGYSNITMGMGSGMDPKGENWLARIHQNSEGYYKKWESRFKCRKLEQYYLGRQWEETGTNYEPYTINLIFSTIETKLPSLMFEEPQIHVTPRPTSVEYDFEGAVKRSLLREDVVNTLFLGNKDDYGQNIELASLDAFFRFGIVEVGYSADWIDNPNADMPILRSDGTPYFDGDRNTIKQPRELPTNERIYVKRILAERFRVSGLQVGPDLQQCNWCAYWDYVRVEDLKADRSLKNTDKLQWSGARSSDFVEEDFGPELSSFVRSGDLIKVWKIYDNRNKKRLLVADPVGVTLKEKEFKRLPLFGLRFHPLQKGWLPMPPVSNWKSPQDEYNETREQLRNHRKRYIRKFIYNKSAFEEEEVDKLINGGDGTFVGTSSAAGIESVKPIDNADLGQSNAQSIIVTKDDFNIISGTSADERGVADRTTATAANITNQKSQIRESRARLQVGQWISKIATEVLLQAEENLTAPIWVRMVVPQEAVGQALEEISYVWHQVSMEDLSKDEDGGINFSVNISVDALSPLQGAQDQQSYITFVSMLQQFPALSMDPVLIRETAFRNGYRNEQVIRRMQAAAQMMLAQQMQQQQGKAGAAGGQGGNIGSQTIQNQQSPLMSTIQNQLKNQVGGAVPVQ